MRLEFRKAADGLYSVYLIIEGGETRISHPDGVPVYLGTYNHAKNGSQLEDIDRLNNMLARIRVTEGDVNAK